MYCKTVSKRFYLMATPIEGVDVGGGQLHLFLLRKDFGRLSLGPSEHSLMFTGAAASIRWLHSLKQLFLLARARSSIPA